MKGSRSKFLIVDDTNIVRHYFTTLLNVYGLDTEVATNGQEAVDAWGKGDFTAILMDLEMPVMGGLEASQIIRQREKKERRAYTPIFAVSGTIMSDPQRICLEAGMDGFIAKPATIDAVLAIILPLVNSSAVGPAGINEKDIEHQIQI